MTNMFKAMKSASMQLEEDLAKAGHPGLFPSVPWVSCKEWKHIQGLDPRTLMCTHVVSGTDHEWYIAVAEIS